MAKVTDADRAALEARKQQSLIQLLFKASRLLNERAISEVQRRGHDGFRLAHTRLLPHLSFEGTRITDLAEQVGITKQAVAKLVDDLETQGAVRRVDDPKDKRAKLVQLTPKGLEGIHEGLGVLEELEAELEAQLGKKATRKMKERLDELVELLEA